MKVKPGLYSAGQQSPGSRQHLNFWNSLGLASYRRIEGKSSGVAVEVTFTIVIVVVERIAVIPV